MSIVIQRRPFYGGNVNSEMPGNSKNVFLHWDDVSDLSQRDVYVGLFKQSVLDFASNP